jgi:hypothetical protein
MLAIPLLMFGGIAASAPLGHGAVRATWVLGALAATGYATLRAARMGVCADADRLLVRNFGRDYQLGWDEVATVTAGASDNITGGVKCLRIGRTNGSVLVGRGASSYSGSKVEAWRDEVLAAAPAGWSPNNA